MGGGTSRKSSAVEPCEKKEKALESGTPKELPSPPGEPPHCVNGTSAEKAKPPAPAHPLPPVYEKSENGEPPALRTGERSDAVHRVDGEGEDTQWAEPVKLDRDITREFLELDQFGKVQAEYVWVDSEYSDGKGFDLCSKCLTLDTAPRSPSDLPVWAYSGPTNNDMYLVPRRIYRCPFRRGNNILVLADTYEEPTQGSGQLHGPPSDFNTRAACEAVMAKAEAIGDDPWFGIEQEYYLLDVDSNWPLGWPQGGFPGAHDAYYCSVGAHKAPGRDVVESHYRACLYAGVKIGGINSEEAPGQWEFQVGPCSGTAAADDLWMARYILQRICEMYHVNVTFDPKPVPGWAGISCHTNYSSVQTRKKPGGMQAMIQQIENLKRRHKEHMEMYGKGNERRMTGQFSTASMDDFSWAVGLRECTIRISSKCAAQDCGYYEDRRPAANMDPYVVMMMIVETTLFFDEVGIPLSLTSPEIQDSWIHRTPRSVSPITACNMDVPQPHRHSISRRPSRRDNCSWNPSGSRQASRQSLGEIRSASKQTATGGAPTDKKAHLEPDAVQSEIDEILAGT